MEPCILEPRWGLLWLLGLNRHRASAPNVVAIILKLLTGGVMCVRMRSTRFPEGTGVRQFTRGQQKLNGGETNDRFLSQ